MKGSKDLGKSEGVTVPRRVTKRQLRGWKNKNDMLRPRCQSLNLNPEPCRRPHPRLRFADPADHPVALVARGTVSGLFPSKAKVFYKGFYKGFFELPFTRV